MRAKGRAELETSYGQALEQVGRDARNLAARGAAWHAAVDLAIEAEGRRDETAAQRWLGRAKEQVERMREQSGAHPQIRESYRTTEALQGRMAGTVSGLGAAKAERVVLERRVAMEVIESIDDQLVDRARRLMAADGGPESRYELAWLLYAKAEVEQIRGARAATVAALAREADEILSRRGADEKLTPEMQGLTVVVKHARASYEELAAGGEARPPR